MCGILCKKQANWAGRGGKGVAWNSENVYIYDFLPVVVLKWLV